jgi:hypothetical protein
MKKTMLNRRSFLDMSAAAAALPAIPASAAAQDSHWSEAQVAGRGVQA